MKGKEVTEAHMRRIIRSQWITVNRNRYRQVVLIDPAASSSLGTPKVALDVSPRVCDKEDRPRRRGHRTMARGISGRMRDLAQSEIRAMTQACAKVKGLNLAQGVCDTPVPSVVIQGAEEAMKRGCNLYTRFDG
jgi:hypothetical protein